MKKYNNFFTKESKDYLSIVLFVKMVPVLLYFCVRNKVQSGPALPWRKASKMQKKEKKKKTQPTWWRRRSKHNQHDDEGNRTKNESWWWYFGEEKLSLNLLLCEKAFLTKIQWRGNKSNLIINNFYLILSSFNLCNGVYWNLQLKMKYELC